MEYEKELMTHNDAKNIAMFCYANKINMDQSGECYSFHIKGQPYQVCSSPGSEDGGSDGVMSIQAPSHKIIEIYNNLKAGFILDESGTVVDCNKPYAAIQSKGGNAYVLRLQDAYNDKKTWLILKYACGHVLINQEIHGRAINRGYKRVGKKYVRKLFDDHPQKEKVFDFLKKR